MRNINSRTIVHGQQLKDTSLNRDIPVDQRARTTLSSILRMLRNLLASFDAIGP